MEDKQIGLIEFLEKNQNNRSIMAQIRAGLSPNKKILAIPLLAPFGACDNDPHKADVVITVAALFASSRGDASTRSNMSFAASWKKLATSEQGKAGLESNSSHSKHLLQILACKRNDVCQRVAKLVLRAERSQEINFSKLYFDLIYWTNDHGKVKTKWANDFWGSGSKGDSK